ncbi:hypothetical protein [Paraburkholderia kururiensis]|uniref:hypothetical protein n=1 Tax=Paraburkholderia kururiensis TaxID=984307 RepID=UPI001360B4B8|nr:hypothetical protein [Paraburkholderia kururiensis]
MLKLLSVDETATAPLAVQRQRGAAGKKQPPWHDASHRFKPGTETRNPNLAKTV